MTRQRIYLLAAFMSFVGLVTDVHAQPQPVNLYQVKRQNNPVLWRNGEGKTPLIDFPEALEQVAPAHVAGVGGNVQLITRTFIPPKERAFTTFRNQNDFVELVTAADVIQPQVTQSSDAITITQVHFPEAPQFPICAEGNLVADLVKWFRPGGGRGGAARTNDHWNVKVRDANMSITAVVESTPRKTVRAPNAAQIPSRAFTSIEKFANWNPGHSMVVQEDGQNAITMTGSSTWVVANPQWKRERNPLDHAGLQMAPFPARPVPTNVPAGAVLTVTPDAVGSFTATYWDDSNPQNGQLDINEPRCVMSFIIVRCSRANCQAKPNMNRMAARDVGPLPTGPGVVQTRCFEMSTGHNVMGDPGPGVALVSEVHKFGGGPGGILGLERVGVNWVVNVTQLAATTNYVTNRSIAALVPNSDNPNPGMLTLQRTFGLRIAA